ncbi:MAG: Lrp/AsnC family transcriptional regulator [Oceanospirillaceae bacterium]|nr:Lrp/AsnC family transcriptional regulator [Oceanospirillaceae bacterium]
MIEIDRYNARILQSLSADGRISNAKLANSVGLSPSACLRRVQELEQKGVIKGYRAVLDRESLNRSFLAYVAVGLSNHGIESQREFEKAMSESHEVIECHNVTGSIEYLLRVEVSGTNEYKKFHAETLGSIPHVSSISTFLVLDSTKDDRGYL